MFTVKLTWMTNWWNIKPWESTDGWWLTQHSQLKIFINSPLFVRLIKIKVLFFLLWKEWVYLLCEKRDLVIWCRSIIRCHFRLGTYITIHDVTLRMQREKFMQPHGLCQAEFQIWHMQFNVYVLLTKAPYNKFLLHNWLSCRTRREKKNQFNTCPHTSQTHLDNCGHHVPSGSHHSMCTCNSLGCSCTHGHSRHCIRLHTRRHLQRDNTQACEQVFQQLEHVPAWDFGKYSYLLSCKEIPM